MVFRNCHIILHKIGVAAVAGVFLLLGMGMLMGVIILIFEHWFYKYALPSLRLKPKGTIWKSRNIMFFSQKLYRFINCVELVSPHHAARELVHSIRQGQIASLFQKSIKRVRIRFQIRSINPNFVFTSVFFYCLFSCKIVAVLFPCHKQSIITIFH